MNQNNSESTNQTVAASHPLKTMILLGLTIAMVVGSGSYVSSLRHETEPTVQRATGLFEMVFQSE